MHLIAVIIKSLNCILEIRKEVYEKSPHKTYSLHGPGYRDIRYCFSILPFRKTVPIHYPTNSNLLMA